MIRKLNLTIVCCLLSPLALFAQSTAAFDTTFTSTYYTQKVSHFSQLEIPNGSIVFLGDSITDMAEWAELVPNQSVVNRGISSDISFGVLARLDQIIDAKPQKVFLLIGINDLARSIPPEVIIKNIQAICEKLQANSPNTAIYLQSILPTNPAYTQFKGHQNKEELILRTNLKLKELAQKNEVRFIDLHAAFVNNNGYLKDEFTHDGLHLSGDGYIHWVEILKSLNAL